MFVRPSTQIPPDPKDYTDIKYRQAKVDIQSVVLNDRVGTNFAWTVEVPTIGIDRIKQGVNKRGFNIELREDDNEPSSWEETKKKMEALISLPKDPLPEKDDGYCSDGWEKDFRASIVSKKIQASLDKEYNKIVKALGKILQNHYLYNSHRVRIQTQKSTTVLYWIKDFLLERFYNDVQIVSTPSDPATAHVITWTNPKINNKKICSTTLLEPDGTVLWDQ